VVGVRVTDVDETTVLIVEDEPYAQNPSGG
jgi:hypothetical protein